MLCSRRELGRVAALLGLSGLACKASEQPDTEFPTEQLGPDFRRLRRRIRKHVPDRERREAALALVEQIEQQLDGIDRVFVDWRTDIAVLPDYQRWDREVILQVTRSHSERIGEVAREVGRLAFRLRWHITPQEWPLVFPGSGAGEQPDGPC